MSILCRFGRHSPARGHCLLDPNDMKRKTHCRRCGVGMAWESSSGWQAESPVTARSYDSGASRAV